MFNSDSLKILPGTDPALRQKSLPVEDPADGNLHIFIQKMINTLRANNGAGLAAPQVGKMIRVFVLEIDYVLYVMINPVIKNASRDTISMEEGCLSFPGVFQQVTRSKKVTVAYFDQEGKKQRLKAKGLLARAIQHEYDHLEGILFLDRCKKK